MKLAVIRVNQRGTQPPCADNNLSETNKSDGRWADPVRHCWLNPCAGEGSPEFRSIAGAKSAGEGSARSGYVTGATSAGEPIGCIPKRRRRTFSMVTMNSRNRVNIGTSPVRRAASTNQLYWLPILVGQVPAAKIPDRGCGFFSWSWQCTKSSAESGYNWIPTAHPQRDTTS